MFVNIEATKLLAKQQAELEKIDHFEYTPLVLACRNGKYAVAIKFIEENARIDDGLLDLDDLLFAAIEFKSATAVRALLDARANHMALHESGKTADMMASHTSQRDALEITRATESFRFANLNVVRDDPKREEKGVANL